MYRVVGWYIYMIYVQSVKVYQRLYCAVFRIIFQHENFSYLTDAAAELLKFGSSVYYQVHADRPSYKNFKVGIDSTCGMHCFAEISVDHLSNGRIITNLMSLCHFYFKQFKLKSHFTLTLQKYHKDGLCGTIK